MGAWFPFETNSHSDYAAKIDPGGKEARRLEMLKKAVASLLPASTNPLPTNLGGVQVQVKDSAGVALNAPLFYVSPTQMAFQNPAATSTGSTSVAVLLNGTTIGQGVLTVENITPGLFAANANEQGLAAAIAVRIKADGSQVSEPILQFNQSANRFEALPLAAASSSEQLFLLAFGTGFRNRSSLANVSATIGGENSEVTYAGT